MIGYNASIITNGLVYAIDAAAPRCYGGSGTNVIDLSRNGQVSTLTNGVGFISGTFNFDGVNDSLDISPGISNPTGLATEWTTSIWYRSTGGVSNGLFGNASSSFAGLTYNLTDFTDNGYDVAVDSSGMVYVGGYTMFPYGTGQYQDYLMRFDASGNFDTSFTPSLNDYVYSIYIDNNDKIYCGGAFTTVNGQTANRIVRLESNGTTDSGFDPGTGFNGIIYNIKPDQSGQIYVVGDFNTYQGSSRRGIIKLNTDGSRDTSFDIDTNGLRLGTSSSVVAVYALGIDTGNRPVVGGAFTTYKGDSVPRICRINTDGSLDTSFIVGTGFDSTVYAFALDLTDNSCYVGGLFTTYQSVTNNFLIKLNNDGSKNQTFDNTSGGIRVGTSTSSVAVYGLVFESGSLYVGGDFTTWNSPSTNASYFAKMNASGVLDSSFLSSSGPNTNVYSIIKKGPNIYMGGIFNTYKSVDATSVVKVDAITAAKDNNFAVTTMEGLTRRRMIFRYRTTTYTTASIYIGPYGSSYVHPALQNAYWLNKWHNVVFAAGVDGYIRVFIDGVYNTSINLTGATVTDYALNINRVGFYPSSVYHQGHIAVANIYNRQLSDAEVLHNFNALRRRFDI